MVGVSLAQQVYNCSLLMKREEEDNDEEEEVPQW